MMNQDKPVTTNFTVKDLIPNWEALGKPLTIKLRDAILYSLNLSPDWERYQKYIDDKKLALKINFDYSPRLKLAIDWALEAGYLVHLKPTKDIKETDLVNLSKFTEWAVNVQFWDIPEELKFIAGLGSKLSNLDDVSVLTPAQWNPLAETYCAEFIHENPEIKLDHVAELIVSKFKKEGKKFAKGETKSGTVKRYLSKGGKFTAIRRRIRKK